jgi:hypothetical protein
MRFAKFALIKERIRGQEEVFITQKVFLLYISYIATLAWVDSSRCQNEYVLTSCCSPLSQTDPKRGTMLANYICQHAIVLYNVARRHISHFLPSDCDSMKYNNNNKRKKSKKFVTLISRFCYGNPHNNPGLERDNPGREEAGWTKWSSFPLSLVH